MNQNLLSAVKLSQSRRPSEGERSQTGPKTDREQIQMENQLELSLNLNERVRKGLRQKNIKKTGDEGHSSSEGSGKDTKKIRSNLAQVLENQEAQGIRLDLIEKSIATLLKQLG